MSHITVVTGDLAAADDLYVDVLDAQPLPEQPSTIAGWHVAATTSSARTPWSR